MFNRYLTYYRPALQFVIFCAIMSMSLIVGSFIVEMLNQKVLGISTAALEDMKEISADLAFKLKLLNPALLIIILMLPAFLFAYLAYPKPLVYLGLKTKVNANFILLAVALLVVSLPFVSTLEEWSRYIPYLKAEKNDSYDMLAKAMLQGNTISALLINTLTICLIPALAEELFFRGCLQQVLLNWLRNYPITAMLIVAILFSAFHGQLSGFLPRVYLGLLLGLVYYYTGNLWISILLHFLNNFISVFFSYLKEIKAISFDVMETGNTPLLLGLLSLALTTTVLYFFNKKRVAFVPVEVEKETDEMQD